MSTVQWNRSVIGTQINSADCAPESGFGLH